MNYTERAGEARREDYAYGRQDTGTAAREFWDWQCAMQSSLEDMVLRMMDRPRQPDE